LTNGELLVAAEENRFDPLLTTTSGSYFEVDIPDR